MAGLHRSEVWITNGNRCRPMALIEDPERKIFLRKNRPPSLHEIRCPPVREPRFRAARTLEDVTEICDIVSKEPPEVDGTLRTLTDKTDKTPTSPSAVDNLRVDVEPHGGPTTLSGDDRLGPNPAELPKALQRLYHNPGVREP